MNRLVFEFTLYRIRIFYCLLNCFILQLSIIKTKPGSIYCKLWTVRSIWIMRNYHLDLSGLIKVVETFKKWSGIESYTSNNTRQNETTRYNTRQHEHNMTQHETTQVQHDITRDNTNATETIRVQHETIWVQNNLKSILIYSYHLCILGASEAVVQRCSVEKVFLGTLQNSQENTCARVSFLIKAWGLQFY